MNKEIEEIQNYAKEILGSSKINVINGEKEILDILNKISQTTEVGYNMKILDNIKEYIDTKEKMKVSKDDNNYLKTLSQKLKEQETRKSDTNVPPLFKIKLNNEEIFFLTRDSAREFKVANNIQEENVMEISKSRSIELSNLLEIIKRNF